MKRIEAIIRKTKFEDVKDALYDAGVYECPSYDNGMDYIKDRPDYEWIKDSASRKNHKKILTYREITIDNDDYRLDGIFVVVKSNYGTVDISREHRSDSLFLVGTEIDSNINLNMLHDYVINIKNERKYSPVASRDSLETKSVGVLEEDIKILGILKLLNTTISQKKMVLLKTQFQGLNDLESIIIMQVLRLKSMV